MDDHQVEIIHVGLRDIDGVSTETLDEFFHRRSMECTHHRVTGLHGAKRNGSLNTPYLTDKNLVGTLTQGSLEQVKHGHFSTAAEPPVPSPFPLASATSPI